MGQAGGTGLNTTGANGVTGEDDDRPVITPGCCSCSPGEVHGHVNPAKLEQKKSWF